MYSEALAIMDKNTVMYMCEDMKNTNDIRVISLLIALG